MRRIGHQLVCISIFVALLFLTWVNICRCEDLGVVYGNGKAGLKKPVYAFQVVDGFKPQSTENREILLSERNYKGTANTTIRYYDYDPYTAKDIFTGEKHYQYTVLIFTKSPVRIGSIVENNPLNLSINPDRNSGGEEGHIDICSAYVLDSPRIGKVLLQYWTLDLKEESISGTLTDTHIAEASAMNLLWAREKPSPGFKITWPFPIATSTTLQGTINNNELTLKIEGESTNTYRKFVTKIVAEKYNEPTAKESQVIFR